MMSPALLLGLALSAPPVEAEARLLEIALRAKKADDAGRVQHALRGWASLRHHGVLPKGLETEAADAASWAMGSGFLRIYGSRLPGRVRVGVDDPALIVGRLDVFLVRPSGERARLTRAEIEAAGRNEYLVPDRAAEMEIAVEAIMTEFGKPEVVLRRSILSPASIAVVPEKPDPKKAAKKAGFEDEVRAKPPEASPMFSWWWIAVGVLAAGLAGVAIYQEAKN